MRRRYRDGTLVLETDYETAEGAVTVIDCMPVRAQAPDLVRVVEGKRGQVRMKMELIIRFDYGSIIPWVQTDRGRHFRRRRARSPAIDHAGAACKITTSSRRPISWSRRDSARSSR